MSIASSFWAGTDQSLHLYLLKEMQLDKSASSPNSAESDGPSRLLSKIGSVGVISVHGSLNNSSDGYNQYRGATGYPEIRQALVEAAQDPSIGAIVLDISSGGGLVSGVSDTADLIRRVDSVKPVVAHTDGQAASAAYWLASAAREITAGPVAEVGSLGVLTIHQEVSKMMADMGIKAKVLRSAKFKALGNPYEPLTAEGEAQIQAGLDQVHEMFLGYVAERRGVTAAVAEKQFGQGGTFIGQRAVDAGLVDGISNFDTVVSKAQNTVDKKKPTSQYGLKLSTGTNVKTALTDQAVAALAEGGVADPAAVAAALAATAAAVALAGTPEAIAAKAAADAKIVADAAAAKVVSDAAAATAATTPNPDVVAFLQTQLATSQASVLALTVSLAQVTAKVTSLEASQAAFRAIAQNSVNSMNIALKLPAVTAAANDDALLAQHASLRESFLKNFKAGGVAAVSASVAEPEKTAVVSDAKRAARIAATRTK